MGSKVVNLSLYIALLAILTLPYSANAQTPITVSYTNAIDNPTGAGLKHAELFVKKDTGSWVATGLRSSTTDGSFTYSARSGDGRYYFAVQAEDLAGNKSSITISNENSYLLDTTSPKTATLSSPASSTSRSFSVAYVGATDSGSGVLRVELWAKSGNGSWQYTGQHSLSPERSGSFLFTAPADGRYYFAARVYDKAGNSSPYPSGNGSTNTLVTEANDNKDKKKDSDSDGITDEQEIIDGTDPLDRGSVIEVLGTTVCTEWNGFLDGMWNILELSNTSSRQLNTVTSLYSIAGEKLSNYSCSIAAGAQCDVLVHGMEGRQQDSFGKVCTSHDGVAGDLNGRMVYYKTATGPSASSTGFQFSFAMPLSNGKMGPQFLSFNTYQPSLAVKDQDNLVANWIQITNLSPTSESGKLTFYSQAGEVLGEVAVNLAPEQRADYSGHQFGKNLVGQIAWRPTSQTASFSVRNVRYLYDNAVGSNSFDSAFQLAGQFGTGSLISAPVDTRDQTSVLELLNTTAETVSASVFIYDETGLEVHRTAITLDKFQSFHLIVDPLLGVGKRGIATIKANKSNSIAAIAMQYGRKADGGIQYMYGLPVVPALGTVLSGSYNTFLSQTTELVIVNPKTVDQVVTLEVESGIAGFIPVAPVTLTVPAKGTIAVNLNQFDQADRYGTVKIQSDLSNGLVAWTLRSRGTDYVMPAPVVQ